MVVLRYKTEYLSLKFYWIGWKWGYAIMKIRDSNNEIKYRLSKCKIENGFPETEMYEWEDVEIENMEYLTQPNHINFKTKQEVETCFNAILNQFDEEILLD